MVGWKPVALPSVFLCGGVSVTAVRVKDFRNDTCAVCQSGHTATHVKYSQLVFRRCLDCGIVFKSFEQAGTMEEDFYEEGYYRHKNNRRLKRFEHRRGKARMLIRNVLRFGPAQSIMDVGCAAGEVIAAGLDLQLQAVGCDISEYAVESCNKRGLPAKVGSMEELPADDGSIDIVVMKHVLEHTPAPQGVLREVRRVLSPTGRLLVAVPDLGYWKAWLWRRRGRYFRPDSLGRQHYIYYKAEDLAALLQQCGFAILSSSKAVYHGHAGGFAEALRFTAAWTINAIGSALRMRREVVIVARMETI